MAKKYKKKSKWLIIIPIILAVVFLGIFVWSVIQYSDDAVGYDKLEQREYTFMEYRIEPIRYRGGGGSIKIYVKEEKRPLIITSIILPNAVDENVIKRAEMGDIIVVWVSRSRSLFHSYNVHDGRINGNQFLKLEDYRKYCRKNDIAGIVVSSVFMVITFAGVGLYIAVVKNKKIKKENYADGR